MVMPEASSNDFNIIMAVEPSHEAISMSDLQAREQDAAREVSSASPDPLRNEITEDHYEEMGIHFNKLREIVLYILVLFYLGDIALDIWVAAKYHSENQIKTGWFIVFCILVPNLYAGYKSLQWYLRAHFFEPLRRPLPWIIRILFFPFSLILRYYDTYIYGYRSRMARKEHDRKNETRFFSAYLIESAEVSMLRLFIIFLEDAPIAVINLKVMLETPPEVQKYAMEMVTVAIVKLIFTMTLGVLHYITSTKAVYHAARTEQDYIMGSQWIVKSKKESWEKRGFLPWPAEFAVYLWHFCGIGSRLVAYALFLAAHQKHILLLVGIRWIINTTWIKFDCWEISFTNSIAFGGVYLFSFIPISAKSQLLRIVVYYSLTTIEDIVIAVLFSLAEPNNEYTAGAFGIMFGGLFLGLVFMCIYYGILHPGKHNLVLPTLSGRRRRS